MVSRTTFADWQHLEFQIAEFCTAHSVSLVTNWKAENELKNGGTSGKLLSADVFSGL